jgi:copper chaperone CopZ
MKTRFKWHRLLTNPKTYVQAQQGDVTQPKVEGLVCSSVCAVRTKEALEALEGVRSVHVDFDTGVATIEGSPHAAAEYEHAVTGAVAGKPLRRFIEHIDRRLRPGRGSVGAVKDEADTKGAAR